MNKLIYKIICLFYNLIKALYRLCKSFQTKKKNYTIRKNSQHLRDFRMKKINAYIQKNLTFIFYEYKICKYLLRKQNIIYIA